MVKHATSLFNSFCSKFTKQVVRFLLLVFHTSAREVTILSELASYVGPNCKENSDQFFSQIIRMTVMAFSKNFKRRLTFQTFHLQNGQSGSQMSVIFKGFQVSFPMKVISTVNPYKY